MCINETSICELDQNESKQNLLWFAMLVSAIMFDVFDETKCEVNWQALARL